MGVVGVVDVDVDVHAAIATSASRIVSSESLCSMASRSRVVAGLASCKLRRVSRPAWKVGYGRGTHARAINCTETPPRFGFTSTLALRFFGG